MEYNKKTFRDVKGYEGRYSIDRDGNIYSHRRNKIMKDRKLKKYRGIALCDGEGSKNFRVHRLVAIAFIPNPDNKPDVNHKDCNGSNNNMHNLEWCTKKENMRHASLNGLMPDKRGEKNNNSKLNIKQVRIIKFLLKDGRLTQRQIAIFFGIHFNTVSHIKLSNRWGGVCQI